MLFGHVEVGSPLLLVFFAFCVQSGYEVVFYSHVGLEFTNIGFKTINLLTTLFLSRDLWKSEMVFSLTQYIWLKSVVVSFLGYV